MARKKRKVPEVNSSSSADIAFLLLIFFLITTSMDTDKGLSRRLPPPIPKEQQPEETDVKQRNVLQVLINSNNELMVNNEPLIIGELRARAMEFIENPNNDSKLPEKENVEVPFFGTYPVTKYHVVSVQNDRTTEYQAYIDVQNEIVAAYNELRNKLAKSKFGKQYEELGEDEQKSIATIFPMKISEAEPKNYGKK